MEEIIREIEGLKNNGIGKIVDSKIKEFESFSKKSNDILFKEMCFCILAANFTAERAKDFRIARRQRNYSHKKSELKRRLIVFY